MADACNPSTQVAGTGGSLNFGGQIGFHGEAWISLGDRVQVLNLSLPSPPPKSTNQSIGPRWNLLLVLALGWQRPEDTGLTGGTA